VFSRYYGKHVVFDHSNKSVASFIERVLLFEHLPHIHTTVTKYVGKATMVNVDRMSSPEVILDKLFQFIKVKFSWEGLWRMMFVAVYVGHDMILLKKLWEHQFNPDLWEYQHTERYFHNIVDGIKRLITNMPASSYDVVLHKWMLNIDTTYYKSVKNILYSGNF
jgi:hypothetical protein